MSIVRKNREISKIMDQVELVTIPVNFIKKLVVYLANDKKLIFNPDDLQSVDSLEMLLQDVSTSANIEDIHIELDFHYLEKTIEKQVKELLDKND